MKRLAAYIIMILLPMTLSAEGKGSSEKRMTFGAEWGYVFTFFSGYHNNFFSHDGWRVDERDSGDRFYRHQRLPLIFSLFPFVRKN